MAFEINAGHAVFYDIVGGTYKDIILIGCIGGTIDVYRRLPFENEYHDIELGLYCPCYVDVIYIFYESQFPVVIYGYLPYLTGVQVYFFNIVHKALFLFVLPAN